MDIIHTRHNRHLFANRHFSFYSVLSFFPFMLEYQYAPTTPTQVGVRALTYPFAILGGACIGSFLVSYTKGHVRELFTISAMIMTAFGGALAAATPNNVGFALAVEFLDSFGIGAIIVPSLTLALYACPDEYIGTTTALSLCTRFLGGSVGVAIYYNVFNSKLMHALVGVGQAAVKAGLPAGEASQFVTLFGGPNPTAAESLKGVTPQVLAAATQAQALAYASALKWVWITTVPFGAICVLCCLALPNIKKYMTNRVAVVSLTGSIHAPCRIIETDMDFFLRRIFIDLLTSTYVKIFGVFEQLRVRRTWLFSLFRLYDVDQVSIAHCFSSSFRAGVMCGKGFLRLVSRDGLDQ